MCTTHLAAPGSPPDAIVCCWPKYLSGERKKKEIDQHRRGRAHFKSCPIQERLPCLDLEGNLDVPELVIRNPTAAGRTTWAQQRQSRYDSGFVVRTRVRRPKQWSIPGKVNR